MKLTHWAAVSVATLAVGTAVPAFAKVENNKGSTKSAEIPMCSRFRCGQ